MNQGKSRSKDKEAKDKSKTGKGKAIRYENSLLHRIIFRSEKYYVRGKESEEFNRRRFELPIQSLNEVNNQNLGFTNQVLVQRKKDSVQLFVPAYVSLKVKSIQQINIKDLVASLNCVMIVRFLISDIPEFILHHLRSRIMVQTNRGQSFFLTEKEDSTNIKMKEDSKFLSYIIRESFPVQIYQDIFLAPFQILRLSLSVTINSIIIHKAKNPENIAYTISFNSMRNPEKIPISYVSDCRLGVYDLAENLLDNYATHLATYDEVKEKFVEYVQGKPKRGNLLLDNQAEDKNSVLIRAESTKKINVQKVREGGLLKMKRQENRQDKKKDKIDYFQYNHFIVPIYKYPGNAWATIFIPIFMLAVLSIAIFFQKGAFQQKIGTIATFVLGFIALIPSIKDQLPPSQKITFAEIVVYLQALNCMLSLVSHWFVDKKNNVWKNPVFLLSLGIHIGCFTVASLMLILHKLSWERSYNRESNAYETTPIEDFTGWNNPHCDDAFLSYNKILESKGKHDSKVRKYEPELEKVAKAPTKQATRQEDSLELKSRPVGSKREKME